MISDLVIDAYCVVTNTYYAIRIDTTAVITLSTWPERNSMGIVQQLGW